MAGNDRSPEECSKCFRKIPAGCNICPHCGNVFWKEGNKKKTEE